MCECVCESKIETEISEQQTAVRDELRAVYLLLSALKTADDGQQSHDEEQRTTC